MQGIRTYWLILKKLLMSKVMEKPDYSKWEGI